MECPFYPVWRGGGSEKKAGSRDYFGYYCTNSLDRNPSSYFYSGTECPSMAALCHRNIYVLSASCYEITQNREHESLCSFENR